MIAVNIDRNLFRFRRIERESNNSLQLLEKRLRCPTVFQKQELEPRLLPALSQHFACLEDFRDAACNRQHLFPMNEGVQPHGKMWMSLNPASHAHRETNFTLSIANPR